MREEWFKLSSGLVRRARCSGLRLRRRRKARRRHVADAHHLTLLDRAPCAKQESGLPTGCRRSWCRCRNLRCSLSLSSQPPDRLTWWVQVPLPALKSQGNSRVEQRAWLWKAGFARSRLGEARWPTANRTPGETAMSTVHVRPANASRVVVVVSAHLHQVGYAGRQCICGAVWTAARDPADHPTTPQALHAFRNGVPMDLAVLDWTGNNVAVECCERQ
jgi:hypothetical protein